MHGHLDRFFRQWSAAAQPAGFPDRIVWQIGPSNETKLAKLALDGPGFLIVGRERWLGLVANGLHALDRARLGVPEVTEHLHDRPAFVAAAGAPRERVVHVVHERAERVGRRGQGVDEVAMGVVHGLLLAVMVARDRRERLARGPLRAGRPAR